MFDFLDMAGTHEDMAIGRYESGGGIVDTCAVDDADQPYETGIYHNSYNEGDWVIVQLYDTKEEALEGHRKWVGIMTYAELPENLLDVSTTSTTKFLDELGGASWRVKKKVEERDWELTSRLS